MVCFVHNNGTVDMFVFCGAGLGGGVQNLYSDFKDCFDKCAKINFV